MQTAVLGFGEDVPHELLPELQELGATPSDCARPKLGAALLERRGWSSYGAQYAALPTRWEVKGKSWAQTGPERFQALLDSISRRRETAVAIVAHHDVFRAFLGESFDFAEVRCYQLARGQLLEYSTGNLVDVSLNRSSRRSVFSWCGSKRSTSPPPAFKGTLDRRRSRSARKSREAAAEASGSGGIVRIDTPQLRA